MSSGLRGFLLTAGAFVIWGLMPLYWRLLAEFPASYILCQRVIWAVVSLALLLILRSPQRLPVILAHLRHPDRGLLLQALAGLLIGTNWMVFIWAVTHERVLQASLGYFVNPLVNVVLGRLVLGERLSRAQQVAVLLASLAVALMALRLEHLPWISLTLAGTFGSYSLLKKRTPFSSLEGLLVETSLLLPLALVGLLLLPAPSAGSPSPWMHALLLTTGLATVTPLLLFGAGVKHLKLGTVGLIQYLAPSGQFLLALWVFHEPLLRTQLIGFILIWTGLAITSVDSVRQMGRNRRSALATP